jgi:hypothetical protein
MKSLVEMAFALVAMAVLLFGSPLNTKPDPLLAQATADRDHWVDEYTKATNELAAVRASTPTQQPAEHVIEIYNQHQEEIDNIWLAMAETATLGDAVSEWQKRTPVKVGLPPDTVHLANGVITHKTSQSTHTKQPAGPPPSLVVPVKAIAPKQNTPILNGHYETRGWGRRTYQVWVPHRPVPTACTDGNCTPPHVYYYGNGGGGCRSCR